ncbi:MAG: CRISPR-associated endonuclease Cas3'', partial [Methanobacterium sp.]|nr:CRISPR-associated endonuclease Cas3'' [Methanobacterium sp.]
MSFDSENGQKKLFNPPDMEEEELEDKDSKSTSIEDILEEEVLENNPSKSKLSEDLVENLNCQKSICSSFVLVNKNIRTSAGGRDYIALTLSDKTGQIDGRIFPEDGVKDVFDKIASGGIYKCDGRVNEFPPDSGKYNIVINYLVELPPEEYQLEDYIRTSSNDKKELIGYIISTIKDTEDQELKSLLKSFFCDEEFTDKFYTAPAARIHHHNYIGGLLDHSVEVLKICKNLYELFPDLNKDLLYTAALLHDMGKIRTYDYDKVSIKMSEEGQLLNHLYLSGVMVEEKLKELNISKDLSNQLLHIILSHHGEVSNGWGSSVDPKTAEAIALHYADLLDARVK